jgi:hypothetical protein
MQATQRSLVLLASNLGCSAAQASFSRLVPAAVAAGCPCAPVFSQLPQYQPLRTSSSWQNREQHMQQQQQQQQQVPPMQQVPPRRLPSHGPHLPLRTQRSRDLSSRLYSGHAAAAGLDHDEPIIVAASWLGAKRGPFSK